MGFLIVDVVIEVCKKGLLFFEVIDKDVVMVLKDIVIIDIMFLIYDLFVLIVVIDDNDRFLGVIIRGCVIEVFVNV